MAAFETTHFPVGGHTNGRRLSSVFANIFGTLAAWNDARLTRMSLSKLTDRELDDIGLMRGDIDRM